MRCTGRGSLEAAVDVGARRKPQPVRKRVGKRNSMSGKSDARFRCYEPIRKEQLRAYRATTSARDSRVRLATAAGTGLSPGLDRVNRVQFGGLHRSGRPCAGWPRLQPDRSKGIVCPTCFRPYTRPATHFAFLRNRSKQFRIT